MGISPRTGRSVSDIVDDWSTLIWGGNPKGTVDSMCVDGIYYMVTAGTGEGGFAYSVADVEEWLIGVDMEATRDWYTEFRASLNPVSDSDVAEKALSSLDIYICNDTTCRPILHPADGDFDDHAR